MTTSAILKEDKLFWASTSSVALTLGVGVANSRVGVGGTGVCVIVKVALGGAAVGVTVAGGVTRKSSF